MTLDEKKPAQKVEPTVDTSETEVTVQLGVQPKELPTQVVQQPEGQVTQTTVVTKEETVTVTTEEQQKTKVTPEQPQQQVTQQEDTTITAQIDVVPKEAQPEQVLVFLQDNKNVLFWKIYFK